VLDKVERDVRSQLDVVSLFQRTRMHGLALTSMLRPKRRKVIAKMSHKRDANIVTDRGETTSSEWNYVEKLSLKEKLNLNLYNRYMAIAELKEQRRQAHEYSE